jgi:hypothetical protein
MLCNFDQLPTGKVYFTVIFYHFPEQCIINMELATLKDRVTVATLGGSSVRLAIPRGCPQGGVLSPLLWCLLVDDLLARLSESGVFIQGYADDIYVFSRWKISQTRYQDSCNGLLQP